MKRLIVIPLFVFCIGSVYCQENNNFNIVADSNIVVCAKNTTIKQSKTPISTQASEYFSALFSTENWPARWYCGNWSDFDGWFYLTSDLFIWLAYFAIPSVMFFFLYKRKENPPFKNVFYLFIAFILLCGLTHLIDVTIFWWPAYRLSALIRFFTAIVSVGTVFALVRVMPEAVQLKSPQTLERLVNARTIELQEANTQLSNEVSQRKRAEEEIIKLNRSLTNFKNAIYDSSIVSKTDKKGTITYVNENFEKISGYTKEELLGQNHRVINSGHHEKQFWVNMWKTISRGDTWRGEVKNKMKDGSYYWVDTFIMPFKDESGEITEYLSIRNDITKRKTAEGDLMKMNNHLEEMVETKTKELKSINKELESFTYSVSHDLRAPLRSITGYAQVLHEDFKEALDDEGNRVLNIISNNATKMGQLIDDLLEFSRVGRKNLVKHSVNMKAIVQAISDELLFYESDDRVINLSINRLSKANVDVNMIKQVWKNLISNALKYTRKNERTEIEIGSNANEKEIIYYIQDNGVGFDMKYVKKLFNVFQRLHSPEEFEGTGVGLAIVKRIIEKHGGKTWVKAQQNKGSIFYFSLPKNKYGR